MSVIAKSLVHIISLLSPGDFSTLTHALQVLKCGLHLSEGTEGARGRFTAMRGLVGDLCTELVHGYVMVFVSCSVRRSVHFHIICNDCELPVVAPRKVLTANYTVVLCSLDPEFPEP
jgi:hypothetical protein